MKRIALVIMTLVIVLSLGVSTALASGPSNSGSTGVFINEGDGFAPIVKAKWEQDKTKSLEDGDPNHQVRGAQFLPPVKFEGKKYIEFWAIVTDPEGVDDIANVYVDVFHPVAECQPWSGSFKYQLELQEVDKETGTAAFIAAYEAGLVTLNKGYDYTNIIHQLDQCLSEVYMVTGELDYHQPWGDYRVEVVAVDTYAKRSIPLVNYMHYVGVAAFEIDFSTIDYGSTKICVNKWIGGDYVFSYGDGKPTVRNIGNTQLNIWIEQDDMGLGFTGIQPNIDWNIQYDAALGTKDGKRGTEVVYDPFVDAQIPDMLPKCNTRKLDFSIHVKKAEANASYIGSFTMWAELVEWCPDSGPVE